MNKENFLNDLYKIPEVGIKSTRKFYKYIQEHYGNKGITLKDVENFVNKQKTSQLFKPVDKKNVYSKTITLKLGELMCDIMDMNFYKSENKNYRFILFVIDTYSRRIFLRALKDKSAESILKGFRTIVDEYDSIGVKITNIVCDMGKEFNNQYFKNYFKDVYENGKIFYKDAEIHNSALGICDRAIRSVRLLFKRLFSLNGNFKWINNMFDIEKNYNNTFHSGINAVPINVFYGKEKPDEKIEIVDKLYVGESVRILENNNSFNKKYGNVWSDGVFEISSLDGVGYRLNNGRRKYFRWELLPVDELTNNNVKLDIKNLKQNNKVLNKIGRVNNLLK